MEDALVLLDCGEGAARTMARLGIPWPDLTHVLISHFHTDHVGGLAPLLFALKHGLGSERDRALWILGPAGLRCHLEALAGVHGAFVIHPGFELLSQELDAGIRWDDPEGRFTVETFATRHTENSLAYRMETDGRVLGYLGDTGPDLGLGRFMRGCQVLVAECSHPDGHPAANHLTPVSLSQMAEVAAPDVLLSVHTYPPLSHRDVPLLLQTRGYSGRVVAARDGTVVEWTERGGGDGRWGVDVPADTG
jgi:ribonuclease BN (tRNA processing enzyme)